VISLKWPPQSKVRKWLQAGFSPGDVAAYVSAGCFDVDRTQELRLAYISPSHIAALDLGWDFCAGKVELEELRVPVWWQIDCGTRSKRSESSNPTAA
jgi:hypothetical protein